MGEVTNTTRENAISFCTSRLHVQRRTRRPTLDETEKILDSIAKDPASVQGDPLASVNSKLQDYGLTVCGSNSG